MQDLISKFKDYIRFELNRSPLTVQAYEHDIEQFAQWWEHSMREKIDFLDVHLNDVRSWLMELSKAGDSPRTIRRKAISLRSFFKWMQKNGLIIQSPVSDIPLPKLPRQLPDVVRHEEIEKALQEMNASGDDSTETAMESLIIEMLYTLGLRRAELASINDSDISFDKGDLKVTGKRSKQRVVPIPQQLIEKIRKWQILRDEGDESTGKDSPLFVVNHKRITPHRIYTVVREALAESSARKKSPHALRHSFASGMLNAGADLDAVREFLGHASLETTQIYTHLSLKEIKEAYGKAHPRSSGIKKEESR